ncbi:phospholipase D-like domain-containing protein [Paludibacterium purpuratum]|uniref:Phosphatidylserine/phosphatidylglycerophosphate/ cardiolipin synthase-like enzyme n=1 Tax=Paludibacterium purpuratum TaxID=1144873 RepID=A0A4R7B526_9NEIS|nr:phospholipase D-like domain-containing protein [Paludibacterium purpuratum]TDR79708.1 phosphatidylserine/phosphatidylglycerophosphate/cardiolipin synthase-like enzyme [Paludibacterium purpuratum]
MSRQLCRAALRLLLALAAPFAHADFAIPGFELVHTAPAGAGLDTPDLRDPATVWREMIDSAQREIVLNEFYVASKAGSRLDTVIDRLDAAGRRGVKIRFLMEAKGRFATDPTTVARLRQIPNLDYRTLDWAKVSGNGIIHAKYFVVDGRTAYVGSQNFDWRSLEHIHETGLKIDEPTMTAQLQAIFEQDWRAEQRIAAGQPVPPLRTTVPPVDLQQPARLLASPNAWDPPGVADSESSLTALMAEAKQEIRIQLLDYVPLTYDKPPRYYPLFDNAIRAALARGVKVKLMVSDWNAEAPGIDYLKSLALLPGMEVRIVTLPPASSGCIPFARVIHSKTMAIDGQIAWVGTSNWRGGYLDDSRNIEVVLRSPIMAARIARLHAQTWDSAYAAPVVIDKHYTPPIKDCGGKSEATPK